MAKECVRAKELDRYLGTTEEWILLERSSMDSKSARSLLLFLLFFLAWGVFTIVESCLNFFFFLLKTFLEGVQYKIVNDLPWVKVWSMIDWLWFGDKKEGRGKRKNNGYSIGLSGVFRHSSSTFIFHPVCFKERWKDGKMESRIRLRKRLSIWLGIWSNLVEKLVRVWVFD